MLIVKAVFFYTEFHFIKYLLQTIMFGSNVWKLLMKAESYKYNVNLLNYTTTVNQQQLQHIKITPMI